MNNLNFYCRICFTSAERMLRPISGNVRDNFFALTNILLIKSDVCSNLICSQCDKKINDTRTYVDDLKTNELQLMGSLQDSVDPTEPDVVVKQEEESNLKISDVHMASVILEEVDDDDKADEVAREVIQEMFGGPSRSYQPKKDVKKKPTKPKVPKFKQPVHENPELDLEIENLPDTDDGKVDCPRCSKPILKIYYRQHTERIHFGIKDFLCDKCGREFYKHSSIEEHMNQHLGVQPIPCAYHCGQHFANKSSMRKHIKFIHTKDFEYVCEICAMKFNARHKLKTHILVKHEGHRWKCPYPNCGLEYQIERSLNTHISDHHEIKTGPCDECGKILKLGNQMFRHKQHKHYKKTHECKFCGKLYRFIQDLRNHEKVHAGVKDYICSICGAKYFQRWNLKKHVNEKHMKQKFHCEITGCTSILQNRDCYRVHIRKVHKHLTEEETREMFDRISKTEPQFEIGEEQLGEIIDDEEKPQKRKRAKRTKLDGGINLIN